MTVKELMDILAQQDADAEIDLSKDNILQTVSIVDNGKFFEEKRNDLYCFNAKKNNSMFYQITEQGTFGSELPIIFIGNEKAVLDFVNERNEDADELLNKVEDAIEWLEDNGYEVEKRKDLVERLEKGKQIWIQ